MSKEGVSFKNRDRFIQLGIAISTLRKFVACLRINWQRRLI